MAEAVNRNLEELTVELKLLQEAQIYPSVEFCKLTKKLEQLLYHVGSITRDLQSYKSLIAYLLTILQTVRLKQSTDNNKRLIVNFNARWMKKIHVYYLQAMRYFPSDKNLALEYLDYINHNPFVHVSIPDRINTILERFHTEPEIFQIAACWYVKKDPKKAIEILLKGLTHHRTDQHLYLDIIEIELTVPNKVNEIARFKVYIDNIQKNINDCNLLIYILRLLLKFKHLYEVSTYIMQTLLENYKTEPKVWNAVAYMELKGCYYKRNEDESSELHPSSRRSLKRSEFCFRDGLNALPENQKPLLWQYYLHTLHENYDKDDIIINDVYQNTIKKLFNEALQLNIKLEVQDWKIWIDYCNETEVENVLINATERCPNSVDLWLFRLRFYLHAKLFSNAIDTLDKGVKQLGGDSCVLWETFATANQLHSFVDIDVLYSHGAKQANPDIAITFILRHIKWSAMWKPEELTRKLYKQYIVLAKPYQSHNIYREILSLERKLWIPTERAKHEKILSNVYKNYLKNFELDYEMIIPDWVKLCVPFPKKDEDDSKRRLAVSEVLKSDFAEVLKTLHQVNRSELQVLFDRELKKYANFIDTNTPSTSSKA